MIKFDHIIFFKWVETTTYLRCALPNATHSPKDKALLKGQIDHRDEFLGAGGICKGAFRFPFLRVGKHIEHHAMMSLQPLPGCLTCWLGLLS